MRKPKLRELCEAIRAVVTGPYTVDFPKGPSVTFEEFRGKPEFNEDECVGCGACSQVCPPKAIDLVDEVSNRVGYRKLTLHLGNCIFCGQCEASCITQKGIKQTNKYDLATFDLSTAIETVQKELLLCEVCSCVIGAVDHVKWIAEKLGAAAFANPTVMLTALKELSLVDESPPQESDVPLRRADRIRILCPKCRRETTLEL